MTHRILTLMILWSSFTLAQTAYFKLEWDPNPEPNVTWYYIYRDEGTNIFVLIDSVRHPATSYMDNSVQQGIQYSYKIQAKNSAGLFSPFSQSVNGIIQPVPIEIRLTGQDSLLITWNTSQPTQTQLVFDTQFPPQQHTPLQTELVTNHQVLLTNISMGVPYYISGLAFDTQRNLIATQDTSFMIEEDSTITPVEPPMTEKIIAYPNPVRVSEGSLFFEGLPPNSKISVYNLSGEKVWEMNASAPRVYWDISGSDGKRVSSGVYVYIIYNEKSAKIASGKVVILR